MSVIEVKNVSKVFRRNTGRKLVREQIRDLFRPRNNDTFHALRNVSLTVDHREGVALIGANGAGKSTMLSLIAGMARPDGGSIHVEGRVAALLELGSGFHPDLTGAENIMMNAALLGFSERQAKQEFDNIVEFSEIGDFIGEPIRTYSSGMSVRLAFSIAVHVDPAILMIDEVLGVGDSHFQDKCAQKLSELRAAGKTLLCVSHSPPTVLQFCERAIWLHHGEVILDGDAKSVLQAYLDYSASPDMPLPTSPKLTMFGLATPGTASSRQSLHSPGIRISVG